MNLSEKQRLFSRLLCELIHEAHSMGFEVTLGETWRSPETCAAYAKQGKGIDHSLHPLRLAVDLNLFRDGKFLTKTEDHRELGEWWEKRSEGLVTLCWGGRFNDGNHYSIEHNGIR